MSFLPNPVYVPKPKTTSYQSSPNSKHLANTKVTSTLPLKPAKIIDHRPLIDDSED